MSASIGPVLSLGRRQFLVGASGFTLALPLLPSVLVRKAHGADPAVTRRPRLYWVTSNHGGARESAFFPNPPLSESKQLFFDHAIGAGAGYGRFPSRATGGSTTWPNPSFRSTA